MAIAFLNRMPRPAPRPAPTMIAVGVARPSASGQVMTTTVIANSIASVTGAPTPHQVRNVAAPPMSATSTSQKAARSARRWPGALDSCAARTSSTICASAVSAPTLVARTRSVPFRLIVAPMTSSPERLPTGIASPVTIDSSTLDSPSSTTPSTGSFEPGRTSSRSPAATSAVGMSTIRPSRMTVAAGGDRSSSRRIASLAPPRARISNQWPSSTNAASTVAASKKTSPPPVSVTPTE